MQNDSNDTDRRRAADTAAPRTRRAAPDSPERSGRLVCVDFDGTITRFDVLYTIILRYAEPGWQEYERAWRAGKISSAECMRGELSKLHKTQEFLDDFFDQVPIDPAFPEFVDRCREQSLPILVVSDGLDYYIERILARFLDVKVEIISNRAEFVGGKLRLEAPYPAAVNDHAGNFKGHHIRQLKKQFAHVTMIGDGFSDRGAALAADRVFAKGELAEACRDHGIAHTPFADFADLLRCLC